MGETEWYRNEKWNSKIEKYFFSKLKLSRNKTEYLRIQAVHLVSKYPKVTLKLIDEYFRLEGRIFDSTVYNTQANAYVKLGNTEKVIESYEKALECEKRTPNIHVLL